MVACSIDSYFIINRDSDCFWRWFGSWSIYLFIVLMKLKISKAWVTILVLVTGLLVIYFFYHFKSLLYVAITILTLSFLSKFLREKIAWAWMKFAEILGFVNGKIILTLIYFLLLTPIAFIYRLSGKNNLNLKKRNAGSYFTDRNHEYNRDDLENVW